jgi:hypothetical protein
MRVFTCKCCPKIHLEIGNTQVHFHSLHDLKKYLENLNSIDAAYYAGINRKKGLTKVIILPLDNTGSVHLGLTEQEFENLKDVIRDYVSKDRTFLRSNTEWEDLQTLCRTDKTYWA